MFQGINKKIMAAKLSLGALSFLAEVGEAACTGRIARSHNTQDEGSGPSMDIDWSLLLVPEPDK